MRELDPLDVLAAKREKHLQEKRSLRRNFTIMLIVMGGVFACFALLCFALAVYELVSGQSHGSAVGAGVFGLLWAPLAWSALTRGSDYVREDQLDARLRAVGVAGRAVIVAFREARFRGFKGDTRKRVTFTLQVDVAGRPPYTVVCTKCPSQYWDPVEGEGLAVLVDPTNPQVLIVDWHGAAA